MPGKTCEIGHWYIVRWSTIELQDVDALIAKLRNMKQQLGREVTYVAIQDDDYVEPSDAVKKYTMAKFGEIAALITLDYLVISAKGLKASLQRTLIRAAIAVGSVARVKDIAKVVVVGSFAEVLKREAGHLPASPVRILEQLRGHGILPADRTSLVADAAR